MAIGVRPGEISQYVLKADHERPDGSVFSIITFDAEETAKVLDQIRAGKGSMMTSVMIINMGVVGWEKFRDKNGVVIAYEKGRAADNIPYQYWEELEVEILDKVVVSDDLKKSS